MNLEMLGQNTSQAEVTHISSHGIWILANDEEMFLSYQDFPQFEDVPIRQILNIQEPFPNHFYWPDLDVDLSKEIIKNPERFPLKAKAQCDAKGTAQQIADLVGCVPQCNFYRSSDRFLGNTPCTLIETGRCRIKV